MDVRTDILTGGRNFSPFYRTLSPVGAAAQKEGEDENGEGGEEGEDEEGEGGEENEEEEEGKVGVEEKEEDEETKKVKY